MHPTIIYILGAGNSGSTLLSMVLGGHSQIASVGEMIQMDRWHANGGLCSCGAKLTDCEVWGEVMRSADAERPAVPLAPLPSSSYFYGSCAGRFRNDVHMPKTIRRNVDIYTHIQRATACNVIVDASKNPLHFYYLYRTGFVRLVPVLLVREGQEYLESSVRRGRSLPASILRWSGLNWAARKMLREARLLDATVHVRYRDFVADPANTLQRICEAADLTYEPEMLSFHERPHHNIAGTRSRFKARPIENAGPKSRNLSLGNRLAFNLLAGPLLNRLFGA